ncbi:MAG: lipopolysaccharide transport periplasmic protein LptA [Halorhodospira sp.]
MSCADHPLRRLPATLAALLLLATTGPSLAQDSGDRAPPVEVEADTVDVDATTGVSIYQGDAVMTRGAMRITGDRMEVYTREDTEGRLDHILVKGSPATFRDHPEEQPRPIHAEARQMAYHAHGPERARFEGSARLWQSEDETAAQVIEVDLEHRTMRAQGAEKERARTTLYPGRREAD